MKIKKMTASDVICCFCTLVLMLTLCEAFLPYKEEKVYSSLIRLHVIANSDSEYDQSLKLKVRDEILKLAEEPLSNCKTIEEAEEKLNLIKDDLTAAAERVIAQNGQSYGANAEIGKEKYDTRVYDGISFPKGEYVSFKLILGNGEGKNWWCVLFPPLCLNAASAKKGLSQAGIDEETQRTFTGSNKKYRFKFKLLEWFSS